MAQKKRSEVNGTNKQNSVQFVFTKAITASSEWSDKVCVMSLYYVVLQTLNGVSAIKLKNITFRLYMWQNSRTLHPNTYDTYRVSRYGWEFSDC